MGELFREIVRSGGGAFLASAAFCIGLVVILIMSSPLLTLRIARPADCREAALLKRELQAQSELAAALTRKADALEHNVDAQERLITALQRERNALAEHVMILTDRYVTP